ncbi:hypothetical protein NMY22_g11884 [Coprinellus aureogranulatus]|nr:hypothetical protein NMY22_g11884 [Coprinellus aureogranulatus]
MFKSHIIVVLTVSQSLCLLGLPALYWMTTRSSLCPVLPIHRLPTPGSLSSITISHYHYYWIVPATIFRDSSRFTTFVVALLSTRTHKLNTRKSRVSLGVLAFVLLHYRADAYSRLPRIIQSLWFRSRGLYSEERYHYDASSPEPPGTAGSHGHTGVSGVAPSNGDAGVSVPTLHAGVTIAGSYTRSVRTPLIAARLDRGSHGHGSKPQ